MAVLYYPTNNVQIVTKRLQQGFEPVQGTKTENRNERNFRGFYKERERKRKRNGLQLFRNRNVILKCTKPVNNVFFFVLCILQNLTIIAFEVREIIREPESLFPVGRSSWPPAQRSFHSNAIQKQLSSPLRYDTSTR